jgi:hypothetical protein
MPQIFSWSFILVVLGITLIMGDLLGVSRDRRVSSNTLVVLLVVSLGIVVIGFVGTLVDSNAVLIYEGSTPVIFDSLAVAFGSSSIIALAFAVVNFVHMPTAFWWSGLTLVPSLIFYIL